ncbi:MAG: histidine--tRNA ligase [Cytophagales bacterium]|nr:histidine--tRNA ligase [Cytophagales bacterium]
MSSKISAIKGMNDILPDTSAQWEWLEEKVRRVMSRFAYRNIRTPIVESTHLFVRGLGDVTDIVEKEMYSFEDKMNGDALTLRPENTAGVVRAAIEHNLLYDAPRRLYYMGPMFRHERPQRGRYRQFHQIGAEALGFGGAEMDAEMILLADALWRDLGLTQGTDYRLEIGSLGQSAERKEHRAALIAYFEAHLDQLDAEATRRLHTNPLRILDTKNPAMQSLVEAAPRLMDYLGDASMAHFKNVGQILDANGIAYTINPRLVRGMDYYNLTVFEFVTPHLGAQGTICGGGRYDDLMAQMGGKAAPAVGWALGVERVLELLKELNLQAPAAAPDAYAVIPDWQNVPRAMAVVQVLRRAGLAIQMQASTPQPDGVATMPSFKAQFKRADASGAKCALIFGADELAGNSVAVKLLRTSASGDQQQTYSLNDLAKLAKALQSN